MSPAEQSLLSADTSEAVDEISLLFLTDANASDGNADFAARAANPTEKTYQVVTMSKASLTHKIK